MDDQKLLNYYKLCSLYVYIYSFVLGYEDLYLSNQSRFKSYPDIYCRLRQKYNGRTSVNQSMRLTQHYYEKESGLKTSTL